MSVSSSHLVKAAKAGNAEEVIRLLGMGGISVNHAEWNGETALSAASKFGHARIVQMLVEKGANPNFFDKKGETAMMQACNEGHFEITEILLKHGGNPNCMSKLGYTALMGATINSRVDLVELLLGRGARKELTTKDGKMAVDFAKTEALQALLHVEDEGGWVYGSVVVAEAKPDPDRKFTADRKADPHTMSPFARKHPHDVHHEAKSVAAAAPSHAPPPPPPPPSTASVPTTTVTSLIPSVVNPTTADASSQEHAKDVPAVGGSTVAPDQRNPEMDSSLQHSAPAEAEAPSAAKRLATSQLLHQLIAHCDGHDHHHSKLPYRAFRDRIAHLKHIYCGTGGLLEVATLHNQECVPEYFALRMEKHLQEALPHVDPHVKRGYINLTGAVDRKTLAKFAETDRIITQCLRELVEALQALQIAELNAALNAQHRLGPEIVYELHIQESSPLSDSHSQYETEDPHTPLLHPDHRSPLGGLATLLSGRGGKDKDGRIQSLNLSRPTVAPRARRAPTRRKFEVDDNEESSLLDLLPSLADITARLSSSVQGNWKHYFGAETNGTAGVSSQQQRDCEGGTNKVDKIPDEWFELPSEAGTAKARTTSTAESAEQEACKWAHLENLAEGTSGNGKRPAAPHSPAPSHGQDSLSSSLLSGTPNSSGRTPKRINENLIAKLGGFDPTKVKPPGRSPAREATPVDRIITQEGNASSSTTATAAAAAAAPMESSAKAPTLPNLDRATNHTARRAPARRRFELLDGEMPTLVAPLPVPAAPVTPKTPSTIGSTLKNLFKPRPSLVPASVTVDSNGRPIGTTGVTSTQSEPASTLQLPGVLADGPQSPASTGTPKTPSAGIAGMLGNLGSLAAGMSLLGGKSRKQSVTTHSAVASPSSHSVSDHAKKVDGVSDFVRGQSMDGGDMLSMGKVVVQNVALAAEKLPIIGVAAVLMLQLIDLCDAYRCNKRLFESLKARMQYMYKLYFAEGGVADIAHQKGKDSVVEPFARHLEVIILDAIDYLAAFTEKGFFHKLLSGRRPQQRFAEIDMDITKCLDGLTVALQLLQIADLTAALENLQVHKKAQEDVYQVVTDIQRRVDVNGGLHGVKTMNHAQLQELCEELGVRDAAELREEVTECQERIEVAVDKVSENVREIKSAVADGNQQFVELKEMISELHQEATHKHFKHDRQANHVDLSLWKLREAPQIDRKLLLGSGSFGSVYAGSYLGRQAAFKLPNRNAGVMQMHHNPALQKEVHLHLRVCACPGVVQILAVALQSNELTSEPCVIMERAIGSLYDYLHRYKRSAKFLPAINFSPTSKLTLNLQVASAMEYISAAGLIHRDIKASNVLLFFQGSNSTGGDPDVCAKICDFGLSKSTSAESSFAMSSHISVKGTPSYLAPEAFDGQYSTASDVYAYGVLLNETLTEQLPVPVSVAGHMAPTIFQLRDAVCRDGERPVLYDEIGSIGDSLRDLITGCWTQQAVQRCTFAQVTVELTHILHAALTVAKYGTSQVEGAVVEESSSQRYPTFSPMSSPRAHVASPVISTTTSSSTTASARVGGSAVVSNTSAVSTQETCLVVADSSVVNSATTTESTAAAVPAVAGPVVTAVSPASTMPLRNLEDLSVQDVGALMDFIHLHPLREVLISHQVSGIMLSYCEGVDDLLSKEYGLGSRGLAGGLMKKIQDWKVNGVPHC